MSTETTNKKIKIDNGTTFGKTYTDKAIDAKLPTDLIATAKKLSLGVGNTALGNGVNLDGFAYDEATKTLKASGGGGSVSPTLRLLDMETGQSRTSITEEEKANLDNGLYNQVIYMQDENDYIGYQLPTKLIADATNQAYSFATFSADENTLALTGINLFDITIDGKDETTNTYPITISSPTHIALPGSGGGIPILDITLDEDNPEPLTDAQVNLLQANDGKLVIININFKADGTSLQATPTLAYILTSGPIIELGGFKALICAGYFPYFNSMNNFAWSNTYITVNKDNTFSFVSNGFKIPNETEAGKVLMVSDSTYQDGAGKMIWSYEFKTISLFGKYSILVPYYNNSTDTNILPLPADASTSTYVLKAVNGVIKWVKEV